MKKPGDFYLVCGVFGVIVGLGIGNNVQLYRVRHQLSQTVTCVLPEAATTTTVKR